MLRRACLQWHLKGIDPWQGQPGHGEFFSFDHFFEWNIISSSFTFEMIKIILPKISQTTSVLYHTPEPRLVHATHLDSCMSPAMVPICWAPSCRGPDPLRSRRTAGTDYGAIFTISIDHRLVLVKQIKKRANQANTRHTVWAMALPWSSQHCKYCTTGRSSVWG